MPYLVIKWMVYANVQALLNSFWGTHKSMSNVLNLAAGAVAGACAATAVTPVDVIKTRMQSASDERNASARQISRQLFAEGGLAAFFRGLGPRLMRIPMYTAVTLATFDFVKSFFEAANLSDLRREL